MAGDYKPSGAVRRIILDVQHACVKVQLAAGATHVLDFAADVLAFAHRGAVTVLRGLMAGPRVQCVVKVPSRPAIYALALVDEVLYVGSEGGKGMLGGIDRPPRRATLASTGSSSGGARQAEVDRWFALHGTSMIAVDDRSEPRDFLILDVARPPAPRFVEAKLAGEEMLIRRIVMIFSYCDWYLQALRGSAASRPCSHRARWRAPENFLQTTNHPGACPH
jgi:hypothetical protein